MSIIGMGERGGESTWMSLWVINANKLRRICQLVFLCSVVVSLMFLPSSTFFSSPLFLPSIFFLSTLCCFTKYNIISSKQKKCILIEIKCHYLITCFITCTSCVHSVWSFGSQDQFPAIFFPGPSFFWFIFVNSTLYS